MKRRPSIAGFLLSSVLVITVACDGDGSGGAVDGGVSDGGVPGARDPLSAARWSALAPMPQPRYYVAVTSARGKVFVVGGFNDADAKAVHVFDPATGAWSATKVLPSLFRMANAAGVGDRLFVLGGRDNPATFEYDFATDDWIARAPLPVTNGRGAAAVGVYGTKVLLAGGVLRGQSANALNTGVRKAELLTYDTVADTWEMTGEMPIENGYAMGAVIGKQFWILGGSTNIARTDQVLVYDIEAKTWATKPPLPKSISSAAVGVIGGRIFVTGGIATEVGMISPDTVVLDVATGVWATAAPMPTPRFGTGGTVIGNQFFVATGIGDGATA
ncbi:MAG TPA: kelch repeat-containing protein, partial [Polyangia bacterium]